MNDTQTENLCECERCGTFDTNAGTSCRRFEREGGFETGHMERLKGFFREHDVVFLLTDTRESRWLHTFLGRVTDTVVTNAVLGLDSWFVM